LKVLGIAIGICKEDCFICAVKFSYPHKRMSEKCLAVKTATTKNKVRRRGLRKVWDFLQPAEAGFAHVAATLVAKPPFQISSKLSSRYQFEKFD
jgi:hypothetical protein